MKLFDSHCHVQFPQYDADRAEVLARMREKEMGAVIVGTDLETSRAGLQLARQHDFLWATVGCHPNSPPSGQATPTGHFDISTYEELARDPKVVAIGECGLDYFRSEKTGQKERFEKQLALAHRVQKTAVIHCREAHDDMLGLLFLYSQEYKNKRVPVVMHFFSGTTDVAKKYLELGCYLSFAGPVTFTDMYDEAIRITPLDKILAETDAPFAAPAPYRGRRNEPAYVEEVVRKIAAVKGISVEETGERLVHNAVAAFTIRI